MNRIKILLAGTFLALFALLPTLSAHADSNLIANPSFETASGTAPADWQKGSWGTNTSTYTYETTGHTGGRSATVKIASYQSGEARWVPTSVAVTPNTTYAFSDWYKSTVKSSIDAVVTGTDGTETYLYVGDYAVSATWKQVTANFKAPANAKSVSFYHYIKANGSLTTDDFSLTGPASNPNPTAPTVSVTAPANNATVSGTVNVTASASDAQGMSSVQFVLDGANLGAADTTAPYSTSWNTTTATNGAHTLTAIAKNILNLTTTSTTVNVTVDNPTAPTVSVTAPVANVTVSGTQTVTATAGGNRPISSVQFKLDGVNLGAADTTAPYSVSWDTTTATNGTHTLTAVAKNNANLSTTSAGVLVTVHNVSAPTVSVTAPANNATISGTLNVTATAGGSAPITSVQFKLDGNDLGVPVTMAPYSTSWNTTGVTNGSHTLTAVATNSDSLSTTSSNVVVTVDNPVAPTVSITAPVANASLSGTQNITATAGGNRPITSVQFKLDGVNFGAPDTVAPYTISWDTTTATNAIHTLSAVATNNASLTTASGNVDVKVNNTTTPPPTNLVPNPSVETNSASQPTQWSGDSWGTNTATVTYENTGRTGSHSVKAAITSYTDGDAKWYFNEVPATAGKTYTYTNWYKSDVETQIDAKVTLTDGSVSYSYVTLIPASPTDWSQAKAQFVAPANAKTITFFQLIDKVGYVQYDDFSLTSSDPVPFIRPIVSIAFDDGWRTQYTNAVPLLQQNGFNATFYIISGGMTNPAYMNTTMLQSIKDGGNQIASHTVTHPHLPTLTVAQMDQELGDAQTQLRTAFGTPGVADDFASPYGDYNSTVQTEIKKYYRSHRTVEEGYNTKDTFDAYTLKSYLVVASTTPADVAAWVAHAQATNTWLIITYHVVDNPATSADPEYMVTPADLATELNMIKQSGVTVETVSQALNEIQPQL